MIGDVANTAASNADGAANDAANDAHGQKVETDVAAYRRAAKPSATARGQATEPHATARKPAAIARSAAHRDAREPTGKRGFHPDPRTKLLLLFVWALAVFFSPGLWFEGILMLLAVAFGFASGKGRMSLILLAVYAAAMGCALAVAALDDGVLRTMLLSFFMLLRKVMPCALLAAVIVSTTHVNEFMSALSRMRIPRSVTIPLSVMLRYVPAIREDWRFIKDAMRMRGVNPTFAGFLRRPATTVECLYVPLMMSASDVADELSMAAVARGIENPAPRTCLVHIEFGLVDALIAVVGVATVAAAVVCTLLEVGL